MNLLILGTNHQKTPLDLRERLAFVADTVSQALHDAYQTLNLQSLVIISTCNRTELVAFTEDNQDVGLDQLRSWLCHFQGIEKSLFNNYSYSYTNDAAIKHLIEVASGIDSMVLGEPQIFGQIKSAVATTEDTMGMSGQVRQIFQQVFYYAKKVRTDTAIGENPVSVAYVAVQLAQRIFSSLDEHSALLIGAGETIELVARHLFDKGVKQIIVANRTLANAQKVAQQFSGRAILLSDISAHLDAVDIVVSSTASQLPVLGKGAVESALKQRRHRPYFMLDLAVPRDIEKQVADLADVYLYTVDDLSSIVKQNSAARKNEVSKADLIISEGVLAIAQQRRSLVAVDTVKAMREQAMQIRDQELKKAKAQLQKGMEPNEVLENLAHNLSKKLIHKPTVELKQAGADGRDDHLSWARKLFGIDRKS